jgi:hypothetical protein
VQGKLTAGNLWSRPRSCDGKKKRVSEVDEKKRCE